MYGPVLEGRGDFGEWRDLSGGETTGFLQNGIDEIFTQISQHTPGKRVSETRYMFECKGDIIHRRAIHAASSRSSGILLLASG